MKKIISVILSLALVISVAAVGGVSAAPATTSEILTECGGECDVCPAIVVPGIGQSNVWLLDDDGDYVLDNNGNRINCFPGYFDIAKIVMKVLVPALLSLATQSDMGLSKSLAEALAGAFYMNSSDFDGKAPDCVEVEKYPYSVAQCSEYEKKQIYNNIPLQDYANQVGEDHLYYFAYNSFGNNIDIVDELYAFIQQVKKETGHDKVNIVPISMGGTVANGLLDYYPEVVNDLNKVVYIVPALNGSTIVGDVMTKNVGFLDIDYLYNGFLEGLMDEEDARMIEVIARILPDELLAKALDTAVDKLLADVFSKNTNMWALLPQEYYEEASAELLSAPEYKKIKEQTDRYHIAQVNSNKNIQNLVDNGVQVFNIVDYDFPLYNIGKAWNDDNADGVIQLSSTAMGVHSALVGETLPEDYVQQNTYCNDPTHNHISPDRVVDASTGLLPDTTFYFDAQGHEKTARNDVIIKLATELLATDNITDVYSTPDYPQFNHARDPRGLKSRIKDANLVLESGNIDATTRASLEKAIADGEVVLNSTAGGANDLKDAENAIYSILVEIGYYKVSEPKEPSTFFTNLSLWLYDNFGTAGFSEIPVIATNNLLGAIAHFCNRILNIKIA